MEWDEFKGRLEAGLAEEEWLIARAQYLTSWIADLTAERKLPETVCLFGVEVRTAA